MPRGDQTGPRGMGPMTGRTAGFCAGYDAPGFMNSYGGRMGGGFGWGRGYGMGRGLRWGAFRGNLPFGSPAYDAVPYSPAPYNPDQEMVILQNHAKALGDQLEQIQKRISDLEAEVKKESK